MNEQEILILLKEKLRFLLLDYNPEIDTLTLNITIENFLKDLKNDLEKLK